MLLSQPIMCEEQISIIQCTRVFAPFFHFALQLPKGTVTLGNLSCNMSRNLVAALRHKLHESLPIVTCSEMNLARNVFVAVTVAKMKSVLLRAMVTATKTLRANFISGHVTLGNDSGNLYRNGATRLRDTLQE